MNMGVKVRSLLWTYWIRTTKSRGEGLRDSLKGKGPSFKIKSKSEGIIQLKNARISFWEMAIQSISLEKRLEQGPIAGVSSTMLQEYYTIGPNSSGPQATCFYQYDDP